MTHTDQANVTVWLKATKTINQNVKWDSWPGRAVTDATPTRVGRDAEEVWIEESEHVGIPFTDFWQEESGNDQSQLAVFVPTLIWRLH